MANEKQTKEAMRQIIFYLFNTAPEIHKWYSEEGGWCYLSDASGDRFLVTSDMPLSRIDSIVNKIKRTNGLR